MIQPPAVVWLAVLELAVVAEQHPDGLLVRELSTIVVGGCAGLDESVGCTERRDDPSLMRDMLNPAQALDEPPTVTLVI